MKIGGYCKECGKYVVFDYIKMVGMCDYCNKEVTRQEIIPEYKRDTRVVQLKAMHSLMVSANDESIYMSWIYTMPDEPSEEDFHDIAIDDEQYNECFDKFIKLISKNGNRW